MMAVYQLTGVNTHDMEEMPAMWFLNWLDRAIAKAEDVQKQQNQNR